MGRPGDGCSAAYQARAVKLPQCTGEEAQEEEATKEPLELRLMRLALAIMALLIKHVAPQLGARTCSKTESPLSESKDIIANERKSFPNDA